MPKFLVVGAVPNVGWATLLETKLNELGAVDLIRIDEFLERMQDQQYDVVIMDASTVENVHAIVRQAHRLRPRLPIMIASASPTWEDARQAFLAGATDYVRRSMDAEAVVAAVRDILERATGHGTVD